MLSLIVTLLALALCFAYWGTHFLTTILVLSFLIFFHELGHFLVAKYFKVRILTFSIGFGKPIFVKHYNGTDYQLSSIFLGGYVKMKGQDDSDPSLKNYDADSYLVLHPLKKILILFAGPFFNLLLAFFIYIFLGFYGVEKLAPTIGHLHELASKEFKINDKILAINGKNIKTFDEIKPLLKTGENEVKILRENKIIDLKINTFNGKSYNNFGQLKNSILLGISPNGESVKIYHNNLTVFSWAFSECINNSTLILKGLKKLLTNEIPANNISGIISIADITSKASSFGLGTTLLIAALLSINLGLLNLLPIPVLDGGHIMFNFYELIFRKEANQKVFEILSYFGMVLLFSLMLFATFNDIKRIFLPTL